MNQTKRSTPAELASYVKRAFLDGLQGWDFRQTGSKRENIGFCVRFRISKNDLGREGDTPIGRAVSDALAAFLRRTADDGGRHMFHGWQLAEAHLSDFSPYSARLMSQTVDLKFVDEYGGDD